MKAIEYIQEWQGIYNAITNEKLAQDRVAITNAILVEVAKDRRMEEIQASRSRAPGKKSYDTVRFSDATDKQCKLMDQLGIAYDKSTTKDQASRLISEKLEGAK